MKALTLYQPWATLIAIGAKKFETRSWSTSYRGPLAIHASNERKYIDMRSKHYVCDQEPFYSVLMDHYTTSLRVGFLEGNFQSVLPRGVIVATCELVDCAKIEIGLLLKRQERLFGDYTPGRFMWFLEDLQRLEKPIPAKGAMGLWEWNEDYNANSKL